MKPRKMSLMQSGFIDMLRGVDFYVLDTEITGLKQGEVCSIAIVSNRGETMLDCLVKPKYGIPESATMIHGIKNSDVVDAASWKTISKTVLNLLADKNVVVYADYDVGVLNYSTGVHFSQYERWENIAKVWHCAMKNYAEFYGEWDNYRQSYKWQTLGNACAQQGIPLVNGHTALGDCLATLALCRRIAGFDYSECDAALESD